MHVADIVSQSCGLELSAVLLSIAFLRLLCYLLGTEVVYAQGAMALNYVSW